MNITRIVTIAVVVNSGALSAQPPQAPRPVPTTVWASKPIKTPPYRAGLRPWIKLADLKAKHKGQPNWHEVVVDDGRLMAE